MPSPFDATGFDDPGALGPLDVSNIQPRQAQGAPQPAGPPQGDARRKWLKLIPLVAAAAKGGPGALEGLLQGYQQADAQRQQQSETQADTQRQTMRDQLAAQQQQFSQTHQTNQLAFQREQQAQGLLKEFSSALMHEDLTDPQAVEALVGLYESRGAGVLRPGAFRTAASSLAAPVQLRKRAITKRWNGMSAAEKQIAQQSRASLQIGGEVVPFDDWGAVVGGMVDPTTGAYPQAATKPDVPGTPEERMADALRRGDTAEVAVLEDAARRISGSRREPDDPQMTNLNRQIAEMRLDNMRTASATTGLPPRIQRQVDAQAKGFDTQPVTKRTQTMAEAVSFANSLDVNTKNPSDDQALIYAFAKAMDPDSVVREGEYATVQKYAQSWAEQFGFSVARVFSNTAFLTPQARANMKATIQAKFGAAKAQYDNVRKEYGARIGRITGEPDGEKYLIDYGGAFPTTAAPSGAATGGATYEDYLRSRGQR